MLSKNFGIEIEATGITRAKAAAIFSKLEGISLSQEGRTPDNSETILTFYNNQ